MKAISTLHCSNPANSAFLQLASPLILGSASVVHRSAADQTVAQAAKEFSPNDPHLSGLTPASGNS